jgi:hypothetical protein
MDKHLYLTHITSLISRDFPTLKRAVDAKRVYLAIYTFKVLTDETF